MARKPSGKNALNCSHVDLTDDELKTLGAIIEDWNRTDPADPPKWNAENVLPELIRHQLAARASDYAASQRKPDYGHHAPPAPSQPPA